MERSPFWLDTFCADCWSWVVHRSKVLLFLTNLLVWLSWLIHSGDYVDSLIPHFIKQTWGSNVFSHVEYLLIYSTALYQATHTTHCMNPLVMFSSMERGCWSSTSKPSAAAIIRIMMNHRLYILPIDLGSILVSSYVYIGQGPASWWD